ncbi:hypothetical protein Tco_0995645 [Tanacetum coccineum]
MSNTNTNLPTQTSSVLHNDTVSSCSIFKVQEKTQLSRSRCMNSLKEVKSQFKFLSETLQDFGTMPIFKRTFSQDLNLLEQHLIKDILSHTDCKTILTKLRTTFENAFNSEFKELLSKEDLKGTRIEHGFKWTFMSLFGQDVDTFTSTMLLNVDQLQKQLDKDEFQEDGSMTAFWVVNNQFQKFIDSQFTLDYDNQMTDKYFIEYTGIEVKHFKDTLLQHMGSVKKFVAKRTRHQRQYDRRVNKRQMQTQESKIDTGKAVGVDLHAEQPEIINEGRVDQYPEQCQVKSPMLDSSPDNQTTEYSKQSLESKIILLKKTVAQFQKDFSRMEAHSKIKKEIEAFETINIELEHSVAKLLTENEHLNKENETLKKHYKDLYDSIKITRSKTIEQTTSLLAHNADLKAQIQEKVFAIVALKNNLRKLKGNSVDTKFAITSVLGKPFASQVDVNNNLSRPVTQHYLPKRRESAFAKPDHMIASSSSRNSSKNMSRFRYRFSPNKTSAVYEKTSPRSDLRWKPTGRIFKYVGLRWIPTGKLFDTCTSKVDSEPPHGSNVDIPNIHECKQTLDVSAGTPINVQKEQSLDLNAGTLCNVNKENLRSWKVHSVLCSTNMSMEKIKLFQKSSVVTTADASDKRQQQPDSTSSTSTLATSVTADGNFDL